MAFGFAFSKSGIMPLLPRSGEYVLIVHLRYHVRIVFGSLVLAEPGYPSGLQKVLKLRKQHQRGSGLIWRPPYPGHVLQRPAPSLLVRRTLLVTHLPETVQFHKDNRNCLILLLPRALFPECVHRSVVLPPLAPAPLEAEVTVRQSHEVHRQQFVPLPVTSLGPQSVDPRGVVHAAAEEARLSAALHLHDEPPARLVRTPQVNARRLVRQCHPGQLRRRILQILHMSARRTKEHVQHGDEVALVLRVAENSLEPRVRQGVHIDRC